MHDRRIDDTVYIFGNHGGLWMNAMTWFDHETGSVWTQVWGRALTGEMKGTQLKVLPFSLTTWENWKSQYPDTLALVTDRVGSYGQEIPRDNFVAGVVIGEHARGYRFRGIAEDIVLNDTLGDIPLVIHTNPETRDVNIFVRQLSDGTELEFSGDADKLVDKHTGTIWDPDDGLALEGELAGEALREIPYTPSFDWAWRDFYPDTDFYPARSSF